MRHSKQRQCGLERLPLTSLGWEGDVYRSRLASLRWEGSPSIQQVASGYWEAWGLKKSPGLS